MTDPNDFKFSQNVHQRLFEGIASPMYDANELIEDWGVKAPIYRYIIEGRTDGWTRETLLDYYSRSGVDRFFANREKILERFVEIGKTAAALLDMYRKNDEKPEEKPKTKSKRVKKE